MNRKIIFLKILGLTLTAVFSLHAQEQKSPNKWEPEIVQFEAADRQAPPKKNGILFIGSSTIRKWTTLAEDFPEKRVFNRGFGGSEIADSTFYVDRIVIPYHPKTIVFYAGDNDLSAGKTPPEVFKDFQDFVKAVRSKLPKAKIIFISIKPSPQRIALLEQTKEANKLIEQYEKGEKKLTYIDVFTPMLGPDGQPRPELFENDKLHLNHNGYKLWKGIIATYLN